MDAAERRLERRIRMLRALTADRERSGKLYCCNECYTVGTMDHLGFDLDTQKCTHCNNPSVKVPNIVTIELTPTKINKCQ